MMRAVLLAMLGRFDEAWPLARQADAQQRELGGGPTEHWLAVIATLEGDDEAAARYMRQLCDCLEERGHRAYLSGSAPQLGLKLCALGRYDDAEPLARLGRELGEAQDAGAQIYWRQVQALVHAHRGEHAEADALAREAVAIMERTDELDEQGAALWYLAQVLLAAGRSEDAADALEQALERYERKKILAMAGKVRRRMEAICGKEPA